MKLILYSWMEAFIGKALCPVSLFIRQTIGATYMINPLLFKIFHMKCLYLLFSLLLLFSCGNKKSDEQITSIIYKELRNKEIEAAIIDYQLAMEAENANEIKNAVLVIHGELAHSLYFSKTAFEKLKGDNKELMIIPGAYHCDLYDNLKFIPFDKITDFMNKYLV